MADRATLLWITPALTALALAGCNPRTPAATSAQAPVAAVTPPVAAPAAPAAVLDPLAPPEGAATVDQALAAAQALSARSAADLAEVARVEARIRALASRMAAAAGNGGLGEQERRTLATAVQAARREVESLHESRNARAASSRLEAATVTPQIDAALAQCTTTPALGVYPGCVALQALTAPLAEAQARLAARHEAADAAWRQDRTRLEEASAVIALGADGAGFR